jgi:hypothetical protein
MKRGSETLKAEESRLEPAAQEGVLTAEASAGKSTALDFK